LREPKVHRRHSFTRLLTLPHKTGYSEKKTDFYGNEYWEHYNDDGTKRDD